MTQMYKEYKLLRLTDNKLYQNLFNKNTLDKRNII